MCKKSIQSSCSDGGRALPYASVTVIEITAIYRSSSPLLNILVTHPSFAEETVKTI